jgi:hypothetical protein
MRKLLIFFMGIVLFAGTSNATVGWRISIPATSENPQAISPDVIENNTALDLMLQNYRDGYLTITLTSTSAITIGAGGVMLSNSGGSTRLMVANTSTTTMGSTNIDTGSISPSSTYYIYAYASSTTATTFSVIYSASATSPTGITYYAQIGKFSTDGSSNFISAYSNIQTSPTPTSNGTAYSANFQYQNVTGRTVEIDWTGSGAASGGWVGLSQIGYIGSSSANTQVAGFSFDVSGSSNIQNVSGSFKVPNGWYWEVTNTSSSGGSGGRTGSVNRIEQWQL